MDQMMLIGLSAIFALILVTAAIWFIGHKRASALNKKIASLEDETKSLKQSLELSEKEVAGIPALEDEISRHKSNDDKQRDEITKLTNSLMAEIEKSASAQEVSNKLAKNEVLLESLEKAAKKDKETIEQLSKTITEKDLITAENNAILTQLREVFAKYPKKGEL